MNLGVIGLGVMFRLEERLEVGRGIIITSCGIIITVPFSLSTAFYTYFRDLRSAQLRR